MPYRKRKRKDEFLVVVIVAGIGIIAYIVAMWWKWIVLGVLLLVAGFVLKAVFKKVHSERELSAPIERAQIKQQDDSDKQVKTEYSKASEKQESYNPEISPRICAFIDCTTRVLPFDTLCSEHYQKRKDGIINQCPQCGRFKDARYNLCLDCHAKQTKPTEFRDKFKREQKYRADDGHFVRSKSELLIDNWLYKNKIVHESEKKLPVKENIYCDFYMPTGNVYVEFWGLDGPAYLANKKRKLEIYSKYKFTLIELSDEDVSNLQDKLPSKLRSVGIQVAY